MLLFLRNPTLRYAALELGIIVSGILVALAVDTWAGARGEAERAHEALEALRLDLESDRARIEDIYREIDVREEAAETIRELLAEDALEPEELDLLIQAIDAAGFLAIFRPQRAAIDDLLGSGELDLVEDPELRRSLLRYYQANEDREDYFAWGRQLIWHGFRAEAVQYYDPDLRRADPPSSSPAAADFRPAELRADQAFQWGLVNVERQARWHRRMLEGIVEEIDDLLRGIADAQAR